MTDQLARLTNALADRYRVERELGVGGMATVFLAHDLRHNRKVALKVLRPDLAAVIGVDRFLKEIETTAGLQHPHILPLFDSGQVASEPGPDGITRTVYYVMPFVEGEGLRQRLARERQLPVAEAIRIASEVADALDYAHRQGVIHRDIKPENILLHDGRALVADFGIALAASRSDGVTRMTETGMSLGTPHYMSPEQAMGERDLDGRTDVFALGCVLYEMLTGEPPFTGPTAQAIVAKVMSTVPETVTTLRRTVPDEVAGAIAVALEKIPADRPDTAAEFAAMLAGTMPSGARTAAHRAIRPSRWRAALPWAVAAVAIAALGIALTREGPGEPRPVRFSFPVEPVDIAHEYRALDVSPDGRSIVFVGQTGGTPLLYLRPIDSTGSRPIAGTEGGFLPTFSPDGRSLVFASRAGQLMRIPVSGGAPTSVVRTTAPLGLAWSPRAGLVLGMPTFSSVIGGLTLVNPEGDTGLARFTTTDSSSVMHHDPVSLGDRPEGLYVDFARGKPPGLGIVNLDSGERERMELPLRTIIGLVDGVLVYLDLNRALMAVEFDVQQRRLLGEPISLPVGGARVLSAAMSREGALAILTGPAAFQVTEIDLQGNTTVLIPDTVRTITPRYSPDGRRLALGLDQLFNERFWVYDFVTRSIARGEQRWWSVAWTRDGQRVLGARLGRSGILAASATLRGETELLRSMGERDLNSAELSPDGVTLAVGTGVAMGEFDIFLTRLTGDTTVRPFAANRANEVGARFSPDGRWLAWSSDESGRFEVYAARVDGTGSRTQVSDGGGSQPLWAPDGRSIYYLAATGAWQARVQGGDRDALVVSDRQRLFAERTPGNTVGGQVTGWDIAPDGRRFVMALPVGQAGEEIVVWLDWLPEVKARLRAAR